LLLDAFARVSEGLASGYLVYVGDGPERENLKRRAAEMALSARVIFAGFRLDMSDVYRALDVVVLASNAEGSPMSIIEAMATGKAIIATSVGGVPEQLANGDCGILIPARSREAL